MFKLVVLCALAAAVAATPGLIAPLGYSSHVIAPATTLLSSHPSSLVYSSPAISAPLAYSAPWNYGHLIKKRSAFLNYVAPYATTYARAPIATTYTAAAPIVTSYAAPGLYSAPVYTTAHLIKKRSAPLIVPSTYVAPAAYAATTPLLTSTYAAAAPIAPYVSNTFYSTPYAHFIKKRSAPLALATYSAPSFSHNSRFDYQSTSPAVSYTSYGATPLAYSHPIPFTHVF